MNSLRNPLNHLAQIDTILIAHQNNVPTVQLILHLELKHDEPPTRVRLAGKQVQSPNLPLPCVTLLTDGSTPATQKAREDAGFHFIDAASKLIMGQASTFYTILQPSWNAPAFQWERVG